MDATSGKTTVSHVSDAQRDAADYAVTGLNIVINGVGEQTGTAQIANAIREDFRKFPYDANAQQQMGEQGWKRLEELQRTIIDTPGLPQEQAFNLLAVMAGVVSAVSTAGLVKAPEREIQREQDAAPAQEESTRWRRHVGEQRSGLERHGQQRSR